MKFFEGKQQVEVQIGKYFLKDWIPLSSTIIKRKILPKHCLNLWISIRFGHLFANYFLLLHFCQYQIKHSSFSKTQGPTSCQTEKGWWTNLATQPVQQILMFFFLSLNSRYGRGCHYHWHYISAEVSSPLIQLTRMKDQLTHIFFAIIHPF